MATSSGRVWRDYGAASQGELRIGERKRERNNARSWRRGKNSFPFLCTLENRHLKLCGWSAPERDWKGGRVDKHTRTHARTLTIECCDLCSVISFILLFVLTFVSSCDLMTKKGQKNKMITLIQRRRLIHVPNSVCALTFTCTHYPLPS